MKVPGPGEFEFTWIEDGGSKIVEKAQAQRGLTGVEARRV